MDNKHVIVAAAVISAAAFFIWKVSQNAGTAGDENSNILNDAADTLKSTISDWPSGSEPYQSAIQSAADSNGVPVGILSWLLWKESRYNPAIINGTKRSPVGAMGIAQFMPATANQL
ncbi:MAG: transglycosylase SLT domain-containing protein, partial [Burkholderiaceae bacterium]